MCVVLGLFTVIVGFGALLFSPDPPINARFVSQQERVALLKQVAINQIGVIFKTYNASQILEVALDVQYGS